MLGFVHVDRPAEVETAIESGGAPDHAVHGKLIPTRGCSFIHEVIEIFRPVFTYKVELKSNFYAEAKATIGKLSELISFSIFDRRTFYFPPNVELISRKSQV